ncbi:MAG: VOC family protein [Cumulibacter sp.]
MTIQVSPTLVFNGQARAAFEFYRTVFGGELSLNEFGPMGADAGFPSDALLHAQLTTAAGWTLMGDDSTKPGDTVVRGGSSIMVWGDDQGELERQFA